VARNCRQFNAPGRWLAACLLLVGGCASNGPKPRDGLAGRICPGNAKVDPAAQTAAATPAPVSGGADSAPSSLRSDSSVRLASAEQVAGEPAQRLPPAEELPGRPAPVPGDGIAVPETGQQVPQAMDDHAVIAPDRMQIGQLNLPAAIDLAFRMQPRLRVYLANIAQASAQTDIAYAPYLPLVSGGVSGGGFSLDASGGVANGFSFFLPGAAIPIGLNLQSAFALEEVRMQWLICDFGRRAGRYNQAQLGAEIARLQTDRAYQTIANEVTAAYYQLLRADALRVVAREAVRRANDDLDVARKLHRNGAIEREKVLRAEVQLAQAQRLLDTAESATAISVAALNLAMGVNVSSPTTVAPIAAVPPLPGSLAACLQIAAARRRELDVARRGVQVAQEGRSVARADFAPKVVGEGAFLNFQQGSPQSNVDLGLGFIKLEWGLFEGGKRVGEVRVADSKIRSAMALAESIADTISFQITEAYRQMIAAWQGIDRSQPAVEQARENYRLVKARSAQGDATAAEMTDAETALTRAEQDHMTSIYDYLTAVARLEYAMGITPAESILHSGR